MENKSSNGWKFFALLFGALLAGVVGLYIYKQQNPDYDPWEEPWENSSSPVDLGLTKDAEPEADATAAAPAAEPEAARFCLSRHTYAALGLLLRPVSCDTGFFFCFCDCDWLAAFRRTVAVLPRTSGTYVRALPAYAIGHAKNIRKGPWKLPRAFVVITYPPIAKRTERKRSCVRRRCRRRFMTAP